MGTADLQGDTPVDALTDERPEQPATVPVDVTRAAEHARALVSALPEATVLIVGADERVWLAEGRLLERHGYPASSLVGLRLGEILPDQVAGRLRQRYLATLAGQQQSFDYQTVDGKAICWIQLTPMYFGGSEPSAVSAVIQDVTERQRLIAQLEAERARSRMAEEIAGLGHWELDLQSRIVTLSEGCRRLIGLDFAVDLPVDALLRHFKTGHESRVVEALGQAVEDGSGQCEADFIAYDGRCLRVLMRGIRGVDGKGRAVVTGTAIDLTQLRTAERAQYESEALFRQGFDGSPIGMALTAPVDGRYLQVNAALCRLLGRSEEELLGLSICDVSFPEDVERDLAARRRMMTDRKYTFEMEKRYLRSDNSILWASLHVIPVYGEDGQVRAFFSQIVDLTARREREVQLLQDAAELERLAEVRLALAEERLVLYAQPIIDLSTGQVIQQELLVRLQQRDGTIMSPADFLPVAERQGCIRDIDRWVTRRAIEIAAGGTAVAVNLSAASVGDLELRATIRDALRQTGAEPSMIAFEVTETALMADVERAGALASDLRELGCRFALDDFGTGYGTFTYLKHIPIDYLKIDIEFVRDLVRSEPDERLVRAIVRMARDLGKQTVAEGVEDQATLEHLCSLGVDHAQGYHLGRPAPIASPLAPL
jgi:PAS domain S-box-containing protein